MYFTGTSIRDISNHYEMMGIKVSHMIIYRWIIDYSNMVSKYIKDIVPRTDSRTIIRADEVWLKVSGRKHYLFASIDDQTRYWLAFDMAKTRFRHNADILLSKIKSAIGKSPKYFITDGLPASLNYLNVYLVKIQNIRHIHLKHDMNNNKMERFNGTFRDREINFRGLKKSDTPIIDGMKICYNYTRKHMGLKGKTPAEVSNIKVEGINKWETLIQNASLYTIHN